MTQHTRVKWTKTILQPRWTTETAWRSTTSTLIPSNDTYLPPFWHALLNRQEFGRRLLLVSLPFHNPERVAPLNWPPWYSGDMWSLCSMFYAIIWIDMNRIDGNILNHSSRSLHQWNYTLTNRNDGARRLFKHHWIEYRISAKWLSDYGSDTWIYYIWWIRLDGS